MLFLIFIYLPDDGVQKIYFESCVWEKNSENNIETCKETFTHFREYKAIPETQIVARKDAISGFNAWDDCHVFNAQNWKCKEGKTEYILNDGIFLEIDTESFKRSAFRRQIGYLTYTYRGWKKFFGQL